MYKYYKTILGEYNFNHHFAVDIIKNDSTEMYYTESHEYMHSMITMSTSYGFYTYLLNLCERHEVIHKDFKKELIMNMKFIQESYATFSELCHVHIKEGKEVFLNKVEKLKATNKEYYNYYKMPAFILDYCEIEDALMFTEIIAHISMNIPVTDIPLNKKERKKFLSNGVNAQKYIPNSRYKQLLKMVKRKFEEGKDNQEIVEWIKENNNGFKYNDVYMEELKAKVLTNYLKCDNYELINNLLSNMYNFDILSYDTFLSYPTLLNQKIDMSSFESVIDWKPLFQNLTHQHFCFLFLLSIIKEGNIPFVLININKESRYLKYISVMKDIEVQEIFHERSNVIILVGKKSLAYKLYINNSVDSIYQFIDNALIDSIEYLNKNFSGCKYRVFNYNNKFSILLVSDGKMKIIQPVSIHAYLQIKNACEQKILKLLEVEEDANAFDNFIIKNQREKKELDTVVSLLLFNLFGEIE
ncbi:hypothetical protein ABEW34_17840 [Paenibacillus algorifonticola]|uniref:hypothetical protein n=1 Tax=Paenibacillus algorifonticola TaxID=684063 RepID=UPI003D2D3D4B